MGSIVCPETSVWNDYSTLGTIPVERRSQRNLLNVNSHGNGYAHGTSFSPNSDFADLEGEEMTEY